jgi:hypothetical protein
VRRTARRPRQYAFDFTDFLQSNDAMNDMLPYIAILISALTLIVLVAEKIFGGGNALANKFHGLEKETNVSITELRREMASKVDNYENQSSVGFESLRSGITEMKMALLEFRATVSENLHAYIRKDDYNAGISEVKRDVAQGFRSMDERMGQLQDLILYTNPEAANRLNK